MDKIPAIIISFKSWLNTLKSCFVLALNSMTRNEAKGMVKINRMYKKKCNL